MINMEIRTGTVRIKGIKKLLEKKRGSPDIPVCLLFTKASKHSAVHLKENSLKRELIDAIITCSTDVNCPPSHATDLLSDEIQCNKECIRQSSHSLQTKDQNLNERKLSSQILRSHELLKCPSTNECISNAADELAPRNDSPQISKVCEAQDCTHASAIIDQVPTTCNDEFILNPVCSNQPVNIQPVNTPPVSKPCADSCIGTNSLPLVDAATVACVSNEDVQCECPSPRESVNIKFSGPAPTCQTLTQTSDNLAAKTTEVCPPCEIPVPEIRPPCEPPESMLKEMKRKLCMNKEKGKKKKSNKLQPALACSCPDFRSTKKRRCRWLSCDLQEPKCRRNKVKRPKRKKVKGKKTRKCASVRTIEQNVHTNCCRCGHLIADYFRELCVVYACVLTMNTSCELRLSQIACDMRDVSTCLCHDCYLLLRRLINKL